MLAHVIDRKSLMVFENNVSRT